MRAHEVTASAGATVFHEPHARVLEGRRLLLISLVVSAALLVLVTAVGAMLTSEASATDFTAKNLAPSAAHLFGTDWMGRDMLARTLAGLSTSIGIGLVSAVVSSLVA